MKKSSLLLPAVALLLMAGIFSGCSKQISEKTAVVNKAPQTQVDGLVSTPFGRVPASQVHLVEPGNEIAIIGGRITKVNSASRAILADYGQFDEQFATAPLRSGRAL